ncbi:MAG: 5'-nucleotidase C-terminal domain-containing protein [Rhizobiaceae bacterium]|nr:5'-nucleotidase C-terminal domain-containing protein [Rhizobiaceae bacterium]
MSLPTVNASHAARLGRSSALALALAPFAFGNAFAQDAAFSLNILHFNDFHSRIEPINRFDSTCSAEEDGKGECFGGIARLKTAIDSRLSALSGQDTLVLNAGDVFQGSLFYSTYKGDVEAEFLAQLPIDAMVIGNHEFDDGDEVFAKFIDTVKQPVISGNVLIGNSSPLAGKTVEYLIVEKGGEKIGIIGALAKDTPETSSPSKSVMFGNEISYLTRAAAALEAQGINKIIALTHVGYTLDMEIAAKVPGIDVVVGGHSHTLLSSTDEKAAGPYPSMAGKVPVVQAYAYGKYLGELKVDFDAAGNVIAATGAPLLLDASIAEDAAFKARVAELGGPIEELKAKRVGEAAAEIDGSRESCRTGECAMGNLIADAMLAKVADQGIEIAIQNGGGVRASIDAGEVTMGEVLTVLPFQNTLATFRIAGSEIVAALENGVSKVEERSGRFPQVAGVTYAFDPSKPAGSRISDVKVGGAPIDPAKVYGVVTNNFVRGGGDGFAMFASNATEAYDFGPNLEQVTADFIGAAGAYAPKTEGRIVALTPVPAPVEQAAAPAAPAPAPTPAPAPEVVLPVIDGSNTIAGTAPTVAAGRSHVIVAGDNFWNLAKTYLGDGTKWQMIADANPGEEARRLTIGATLAIPAQ